MKIEKIKKTQSTIKKPKSSKSKIKLKKKKKKLLLQSDKENTLNFNQNWAQIQETLQSYDFREQAKFESQQALTQECIVSE